MNFNQFPTITTDRLILRKIALEDWEIISYLRSDAIVNQYVIRPDASTKEKSIAFITSILKKIDKSEMIYWCLNLKEDPGMIGSICLFNFSEDQKIGEVGYDLHPKAQKLGIMNEALEAILTYGFDVLNLDLIKAYTQRNNTNSINMLKRNHFILNELEKDKANPLNWIFQRNRSHLV